MQTALSIRSFTPPPVAALDEGARIRLKAARMWVILARHHRNPRPVVASLLGSVAPAFCTLMEQVVTAWPDAFTTYPPCAAAVSPDEAALLHLLHHADCDGEEAAGLLFADMLPASDRMRLWDAAVRAASGGIC